LSSSWEENKNINKRTQKTSTQRVHYGNATGNMMQQIRG